MAPKGFAKGHQLWKLRKDLQLKMLMEEIENIDKEAKKAEGDIKEKMVEKAEEASASSAPPSAEAASPAVAASPSAQAASPSDKASPEDPTTGHKKVK